MPGTELLEEYLVPDGVWDEMAEGRQVREPYRQLVDMLSVLSGADLAQKDQLASEFFLNQGITFTVYTGEEGIERIFPFDILPRILKSSEWEGVEQGIRQRLKALNHFLNDIYSRREILKDGILPSDLVATCPHFTREVAGIRVMHEIYIQISGIDLIRCGEGSFYVLEDNLRTPSGVSYMLENREITKRLFPELLRSNKVRMIGDYPLLLHQVLLAHSPRQVSQPLVVLLTPGIFNSAYYEHTFLARQMGVPLVEARDLLVDNHRVYLKTTQGLSQVDVIYRRIDDEYLDPLVFQPDSVLGVPGLLGAYRRGHISVINAIGNGVADDKAIFAYVPDMIRYYLNEEPVLPNVPTYQMSRREDREFVASRLDRMVLKRTNQSGGYGMVIGNQAGEESLRHAWNTVQQEPRNFIAQPIMELSTVPCFLRGRIQPRRVDLRPFALFGPEGIRIVPGGLTRVALKEGSLVVNSSQGGGSKDTWVLDP